MCVPKDICYGGGRLGEGFKLFPGSWQSGLYGSICVKMSHAREKRDLKLEKNKTPCMVHVGM